MAVAMRSSGCGLRTVTPALCPLAINPAATVACTWPAWMNWVASGVPTPVRILQRTDGEDAIDLRLIEYQGTP